MAKTATARGERQMKCPACEGTGIIHFRNIHEICGKCKGIGYIDEKPKPQKKKTEQEWLQTADTEELAEFLNQVFHARAFCEICEIRKRCKFRAGCKYGNKPYKECWKEWLRQPHHENK